MTEELNGQINYRSRNSMVFECDNFTIKKSSIGRSYEWENASPNPLLLGIDDIESVWVLS